MSFTNKSQFTAQIKKDIIDKVAKNALLYEAKSNEIQKQAIDDVEAVDSGLMQSKTFVKSVVNLNGNTPVQINFKTQGSKYAVYVHEGLGTNRRYGRRPFLEIARQQVLDWVTKDTYTPVYKAGSPNKKYKKF